MSDGQEVGNSLEEEWGLEGSIFEIVLIKRIMYQSLIWYEILLDSSAYPKSVRQGLLPLPSNSNQTFLSHRMIQYLRDSRSASQCYLIFTLYLTKKEQPQRISFMTNDSTPYATLLIKLRASQKDVSIITNESSPHYMASLMSQSSKCYGTDMFQKSGNYSELETSLLNMVRSKSREAEDELRDNPLVLACEDTNNDANIYDACVHGLSIRMTDRSVSRSRISRMSTRRDMDIPSILAFTANVPKSQTHLEIPAFRKVEPQREEIPRWSIRRSICPVCSQKWKDRSTINSIKSSGLRRNLSYEPPSVKLPARLRTSITMGCTSRTIPEALDQDIGVSYGSLRNTSATWQLTRARRFRAPKPLLPTPEATAPPSCNAPLARKDLDLRVSRFLSDNFKIQ